MRRAPVPLLAAALATCALIGACSTSTGAPATVPESSGPGPAPTDSIATPGSQDGIGTPDGGTGGTGTTLPVGKIVWTDVGGSGRVQSGHLLVPMDYHDPSKGTFDLFLARHLADPKERVGTLLVNRGGPGFESSSFALQADQIYSSTLTSKFDIVGFDPRGTGLSTPAIDCISDYDHFFAGTDITPDTAQERQQLVDLAKEFAGDCTSKDGAFMPYVGTNNVARDMDTIRRALGETKISYFGFSYGSELGAVWTTMFPSTVRAAVFDGAADPSVDTTESAIQQSAGFEQALASFLRDCNANKKCPFRNGGHADLAFDALMTQMDEHPLPTESGRPALTRGMALNGVAEAMYSQSSWPELQTALADAQRGHGAGLLHLYDEYFGRQDDGSYDNSLEAFQVISCEDDPARPTVAQDDATAPRFRAAAPRFAPSTVGSYFCTFFPKSIDPMSKVTGAGAGPILVMGTTGDPATPLVSTKKMATAMQDGRLVIVTAEGHTGYRANQCSENVIDRYLVDPAGAAPKSGTRC